MLTVKVLPKKFHLNGHTAAIRPEAQKFTLLAEAFPLLNRNPKRLSAEVFSSAQKQPKQNASSQNREENGSTTLRNTREKPLLAGYQKLEPSHKTPTLVSLWEFKGAVSRNSAKLGNYKMPVEVREI